MSDKASSFRLEHPIAIDGDTIHDGKLKIRLWGIDAPEKYQKCYIGHQEHKCGLSAKSVLAKILNQDDVTCKKVAVDRYLRIVAMCKVGPLDVSEEMVHMGWALDYTSYSKGHYKVDEVHAADHKLGIWGMKFDRPSDWRRGIRSYPRYKDHF